MRENRLCLAGMVPGMVLGMVLALFLIGCDDSVNTESGDFYIKQGDSYLENKEYQKAIDAYTKAIVLYTDKQKLEKAAAYLGRGAAKELLAIKTNSTKMFEEAKADLTSAIYLTTSRHIQALAYAVRGEANHFLKKYDVAVLDYKKALHGSYLDSEMKAGVLKQRTLACDALKSVDIRQWEKVGCRDL